MSVDAAPIVVRAGSRSAGPRWLSPQSLPGVLALFVAGYLIVQPLAIGILLPLLGRPRPVTSAEWVTVLVVVGALGATAGLLWWIGSRVRRGLLRYWLRGTARATALATMLTASSLRDAPPLLWFGIVLVTAATVGFAFSWMERWDSEPEPRAPAT